MQSWLNNEVYVNYNFSHFLAFYLDVNVRERIISSAAVINYHAAEINTMACSQHKPATTTLHIIIIRYMRRLLRLLLNLGRWIGELDLLYDEPQFVHVDLALICALPIYLFFRFVNY